MPEPDPSALPEPESEFDDRSLPTTPPCRHLRSKGMYVYTEMADGSTHEEGDSTAYWCLRTMTAFGPDDSAVDRIDCRSHDRSCYEPT